MLQENDEIKELKETICSILIHIRTIHKKFIADWFGDDGYYEKTLQLYNSRYDTVKKLCNDTLDGVSDVQSDILDKVDFNLMKMSEVKGATSKFKKSDDLYALYLFSNQMIDTMNAMKEATQHCKKATDIIPDILEKGSNIVELQSLKMASIQAQSILKDINKQLTNTIKALQNP